MKKKEFRRYESRFKLSVLRDMYENNLSYNFTAKKYGIICPQTLHLWEKEFPLDTKSLSLLEEVINKIKSAFKEGRISRTNSGWQILPILTLMRECAICI